MKKSIHFAGLLGGLCLVLQACTTLAPVPALPQIGLSPDGRHFVRSDTGARFIVLGFNYDHDDAGRLLEDYWVDEWPTVASDFQEMKELGANTVRIHLQLGRFMEAPDRPDAGALARLEKLLKLAEKTGLYLDLTGLGCYHKQDIPPWYDGLSEQDRWAVQARFWEAVAATCCTSSAVLCYDLMNEPILAGAGKQEAEWLGGELGGKFFVQRLTRDLAGRSPKEVAKAWVDRMAAAIDKHDSRRFTTVGVIPWAQIFPKAKPLFYSPEVSENLDYVSVHFYPKAGQVDQALAALEVYDIGKPIVVEEAFPLSCSQEELEDFMRRAGDRVDGWISFYWGKTPAEYAKDSSSLHGAVISRWLERFPAFLTQEAAGKSEQ